MPILVIIALASQFHIYLQWGQHPFSIVFCETDGSFYSTNINMFPLQVVVLHTLPGLLVGGAGAGLAAWHPTTTSRCVHHVTRGLAVMLLLPATVRDCQGFRA